ncbi:MAG: hypothetical protein WAK93_22795 [Solirubrobacteraceae bacterium]
MRPARAIALLGAAYALAGCGASASDQVQAKVQQFAHAVANRDVTTLCQDILAPSLVAHLTAAGISCTAAMETFVQTVQDPTLSVSRVKVSGKTASAVVLTTAKGQRASLATIQLIDTKTGWRLVSLASPT